MCIVSTIYQYICTVHTCWPHKCLFYTMIESVARSADRQFLNYGDNVFSLTTATLSFHNFFSILYSNWPNIWNIYLNRLDQSKSSLNVQTPVRMCQFLTDDVDGVPDVRHTSYRIQLSIRLDTLLQQPLAWTRYPIQPMHRHILGNLHFKGTPGNLPAGHVRIILHRYVYDVIGKYCKCRFITECIIIIQIT